MRALPRGPRLVPGGRQVLSDRASSGRPWPRGIPSMDPGRFDIVVRALFAAPSRRAFNRALVGLTVGTFLAPLMRVSDAAAGNGKKTHKHNHHRKKKRKKKPSHQCPARYEFCPAGQGGSAAGDYSECCNSATDPESGNPYEFCTDCGCCAYGFSKCCASAGDGLCCQSDAKCCPSDDFKETACCTQQDVCCGAGCCEPGSICCKTTGPTPYNYCCPSNRTCCSTGGPQCCLS